MLHTETVEGTTLELLRNLEQEEMLSSFSLAGGTAPPCIWDIECPWIWNSLPPCHLMLSY